MTEPTAALLLRNAGVRFGEHWAVRHISLSVRRGEILSLVGPNGAGKSTVLRTLLGLCPLDEGTIELHTARGVASLGYVPQKLEIDRTVPLTVMEMLTLNMPVRGLWWGGANPAQRALGLDALARLEAAHLADRPVGALSGGEFQRVMIAYALLRSPEIILLDEPLTGVDKPGAELLEELILKLRSDHHLTVLMVSHDLHLVSNVSDRVLCLNQTMCGLGTPQEVLQEHLLDEVYGSPRHGHRHGHRHTHAHAA
jgi:zinc transport system ATP-binding protein